MYKDSSKKDKLLKALQSPEMFIKGILREDFITHQQLEIINAVANPSIQEIGVKACHSSGKTHIAIRSALWFLLNFRNSKVIITAPSFNQVQNSIFTSLNQLFKTKLISVAEELGITKAESLSSILRLADNWFCIGLSVAEHKSVNMQGFKAEHMMVIVDEASGLSYSNDETFTTIKGILSSGKQTKLLMLGNPLQNSGYFYDIFHKLDTPRSTKLLSISAYDTPNFLANGITDRNQLKALTESEIENYDKRGNTDFLSLSKARDWLDNYNLAEFKRRVEGEYAEADDDALYDVDDLNRSIDKIYTDDGNDILLFDKAQTYLGCDIARLGSDASVFIVRQGGEVVEILQNFKRSTMESAGIILQLMQKYDISPYNIQIDETGIGSGVVDRLKEQNYNVNGVNSSSKASESSTYENRRAEGYYRLQFLFKKGYICLRSDLDLTKPLIDELKHIKGKNTSTGKLLIESKADIKKRIGKSPDLADALMLCFLTNHAYDSSVSMLEFGGSESDRLQPQTHLSHLIAKRQSLGIHNRQQMPTIPMGESEAITEQSAREFENKRLREALGKKDGIRRIKISDLPSQESQSNYRGDKKTPNMVL